jgi:enamine deaminase RidA (YjgF/YER057c/UK114 family)
VRAIRSLLTGVGVAFPRELYAHAPVAARRVFKHIIDWSAPMREAVTTPEVYEFNSPLSSAVRDGRFLAVAGAVAVDEKGDLVGPDDIVAQTRQAFLNIQHLLAAAGGGFEHVMRLRYYVTDVSRWAETKAVRLEFLREPYPAAAVVEIARLNRPEWLVEIEADAILPG